MLFYKSEVTIQSPSKIQSHTVETKH